MADEVLLIFRGVFDSRESATDTVAIRGGQGPTPGPISLPVTSFGA